MVVINSGSRLVIITTGRLIDFFTADDGGDGREGDEGVQRCVFGTFGLVTDDD